MQHISSFRHVSSGVDSDAQDNGDVCPQDGSGNLLGLSDTRTVKAQKLPPDSWFLLGRHY